MAKHKGVKKGYKHDWDYSRYARMHEQKTGPGRWKGVWKGLKVSNKKKGKGGPRIGTKLKWYLSGIQTAVKTSNNAYMTKFRFRKKLLSAKIKKRRRKKYY